jgi:hypothetical protein
VSTGAVALAVDAMIRGTTGSTTRDATLRILPAPRFVSPRSRSVRPALKGAARPSAQLR